MSIRLILPCLKHAQSFFAFIAEVCAAHQENELGHAFRQGESFADLQTRLKKRRQGVDIHPRDVPATVWWIYDTTDAKVVGTLDMRHCLNADYAQRLGHVAYFIAPSQRGKGYATAALKIVLKHYKKQGISSILITCYADNPASGRVIEKNGGHLIEIHPDPKNPIHLLQKWKIET